MTDARPFDAHAKPPDKLRQNYKRVQKSQDVDLAFDTEIIDLERISDDAQHKIVKRPSFEQLPGELHQILLDFLIGDHRTPEGLPLVHQPRVYEVTAIPGLFIYPALLPTSVQLDLLDKLFHRDLSNPKHSTNVHMHYRVPYPPARGVSCQSFFSSAASNLKLEPKEPHLHKSISTQQLLTKKLRWMTLGGQYDWTNKLYPERPPPPFPPDIKALVEGTFPMKAEAAIINVYSPGDTLSLHRDVSEECSQPLVSISLGCDGLFVIGLDSEDDLCEPRVVTVRLRSGDAILMSGQSRFAWHAVPKVLGGTCPEWMEDWPCLSLRAAEYAPWRGWMKGKRINLNVRQMFD